MIIQAFIMILCVALSTSRSVYVAFQPNTGPFGTDLGSSLCSICEKTIGTGQLPFMGKRKFTLGRGRKNSERKRQTAKRAKLEAPHTSLETIRNSIALPSENWVVSWQREELMICQIHQQNDQPVVAKSLTISLDLSWNVTFYSHSVPRECQVFQGIPAILDDESADKLLQKISTSCLCTGNDDDGFVDLAESKKGQFKSSDGKTVVAYLESIPFRREGDAKKMTVRTSSCSIIVEGGRCENCNNHRNTLRKALQRWKEKQTASPISKVDTGSHTNLRYLPTPQRSLRYKALRLRATTAEKQLKKLLASHTEKNGISVENDLHTDLASIMEEMTGDVRENDDPLSLKRIFWEQQLQAVKVKDSRQIRWHPTMIRLCLHLKYKSPGAYQSLRKFGVLRLPSERTLYDYTHVFKSEPGFSTAVNELLIKEGDIKEEKDRYVVLSFDEMKIRENLVFDKNTFSLVGFMDLGDVNKALEKLEKPCSKYVNDTLDDMATHMLSFMVKGIFTRLEFPYAHFPTKGVKAEELYPLVWKAIMNLESCGFKVMVLTADGASCNRKFFRMHGKKDDGIVYKTTNPYAEDNREIHFMSDVPHLIKTTRNCWSNSFAHSGFRALWKNGQNISWRHLTELHKKCHSSSALTLLPKVRHEHLHLTAFSRMRVYLATQVLSSSVAAALRHFGVAGTEETAKFVQIFDTFFDCMNVRCTTESRHRLKPSLLPYYSSEDPRFKWLTETFLGYLKEWKEEVNERQGYTKAQKQTMTLSLETLEGLEMTVLSFVEVGSKFLQMEGVEYLLSAKFSQDSLEAFFGKMRYRGGANTNPSVRDYLNSSTSVRLQRSLALNPVRGNVRRAALEQTTDGNSRPMPKRPRTAKKLVYFAET